MCLEEPRAQDRSSEAEISEYSRRRVLTVSAGTGAVLLAGCSADTTRSGPDGSSSDDTDSEGSAAGTFRLLISDQPVAIDEFDELNVSFDHARIFSGGTEESGGEAGGTEAESEIEDDDPEVENETEDGKPEIKNETQSEAENEGPDDDDDQRGFQVIDLDDATVDLTQVVGDKAVGVFEDDLRGGRYTKIELYAADVSGIVEGEPVDVMIPSNKLQIVKSFEVVAGETLSFVFDINVVKKGQGQEYNLLPVISGSGVEGKDIEVEEVDGEAMGAPNGTDRADENEDE